MKRFFLFSLLSAVGIVACSPDKSALNVTPSPAPGTAATKASNEDVSTLSRQFHGKYKVISSVSSEPLDVNLDGLVSTDMIGELPELSVYAGTRYNVDIRIYGPSQVDPKPSFSFMQWWPEQFIRTGPGKVWDGGELINYDPAYVVKHDFQGTQRGITFSTDLKELTVKPNENENPFRWVRPQSVTVESSGRLRVVNKRRLYTRAGVKEVTITTVYERYTTTT